MGQDAFCSVNINKQKILLGVAVLFIAIAVPVTVYLARQATLLDRQAAFGQVTLNIVPIAITKNIGEPFSVEIHANSGDKKVSAIKIALAAPRNELIVQNVVLTDTTAGGAVELIYDKQIDPFSFTILYKKPTSQLPTGSFKVASVDLVPFEGGINTLGINAEKSEAVGYNGTSEDVALSVVSGTSTSYTIVGSLCRIEQCVAADSISLTPGLRPDNKFNVQLSFSKAGNGTKLYKFYRNAGAAVPADHPATHLAGIASPSAELTTQESFIDTNHGQGFPGETTLHYDIDAYIYCSLPATTLTPAADLTPTGTSSATPTGVQP